MLGKRGAARKRPCGVPWPACCIEQQFAQREGYQRCPGLVRMCSQCRAQRGFGAAHVSATAACVGLIPGV